MVRNKPSRRNVVLGALGLGAIVAIIVGAVLSANPAETSSKDGLPVLSNTPKPTNGPTASPTVAVDVVELTDSPTLLPTSLPSVSPTHVPTVAPTAAPTTAPSYGPTEHPTERPTERPTEFPSAFPSKSPTSAPSYSPSTAPTDKPTASPTDAPTKGPTGKPSEEPTHSPTNRPTKEPTTKAPSVWPTSSRPSNTPSEWPTYNPTTDPTIEVSDSPTRYPTGTFDPYNNQCGRQSDCIQLVPGKCENGVRSVCMAWKTDDCFKGKRDRFTYACALDGHDVETVNTWSPYWARRICHALSSGPDFHFAVRDNTRCTGYYSHGLTLDDDEVGHVSCRPSHGMNSCGSGEGQCIWKLTMPKCTPPTPPPSYLPTVRPSNIPTELPTKQPTETPSQEPTQSPSESPTVRPTNVPTEQPTNRPTKKPTKKPTFKPTRKPTNSPTAWPTTEAPSTSPTKAPTNAPTNQPTLAPTAQVTTGAPTQSPTLNPYNNQCWRQSSCIQLIPGQCANGVRSVCMAWKTDDCFKGKRDRFTYACALDGDEIQTVNTWSPYWARRICSTISGSDFQFAVRDNTPCTGKYSGQVTLDDEVGAVSCRPSNAPNTCGSGEGQCIWQLTMPQCAPATPAPSYEPTSSAPSVEPTASPSDTPTEHPSRTPTELPSKSPTQSPSVAPTNRPTDMPTRKPSHAPTEQPTQLPTATPTTPPTTSPTPVATNPPTKAPTAAPTTKNPTPAPIINQCLRQSTCMELTPGQCADGVRTVCINWKTDNCFKGKRDRFRYACSLDGEPVQTVNTWSPYWSRRICTAVSGPDFEFAVRDNTPCAGEYSGQSTYGDEVGEVSCRPVQEPNSCGSGEGQCIWKLTMPKCTTTPPTQAPTTLAPTLAPTTTHSESPTIGPPKVCYDAWAAYEQYGANSYDVKWMADKEWGSVIYTADQSSFEGGMYVFNPAPGYAGQFNKTYVGDYVATVDHGHDNAYSVSMTAKAEYWIEEVKFASTDVVPDAGELTQFIESSGTTDGTPPHVFHFYNQEQHIEESCLRAYKRFGYYDWGYCQQYAPDCSYRRRLKGRVLNDGLCHKDHKLLIRARICTVGEPGY